MGVGVQVPPPTPAKPAETVGKVGEQRLQGCRLLTDLLTAAKPAPRRGPKSLGCRTIPVVAARRQRHRAAVPGTSALAASHGRTSRQRRPDPWTGRASISDWTARVGRRSAIAERVSQRHRGVPHRNPTCSSALSLWSSLSRWQHQCARHRRPNRLFWTNCPPLAHRTTQPLDRTQNSAQMVSAHHGWGRRRIEETRWRWPTYWAHSGPPRPIGESPTRPSSVWTRLE